MNEEKLYKLVCPHCGSECIEWEKTVHHDENTYDITKVTYKVWCSECGKTINPNKKYTNN